MLLVTAHQTLVYIDVSERCAIHVPDDYRERVLGFEGDDAQR
jgi:acyl-CoA thioesterase FadM